MKIAIAGRFTGWMGLHMEQMAAAWTACGYDVLRLDYPSLFRKWLWFRRSYEDFNRNLLAILKDYQPDLLLLTMSRPIYDLAALRRFLQRTKICIWDFDGPNWQCVNEKSFSGIDLLLTVSRRTEAVLKQRGVRAAYLPHGVDCDYYNNKGIDPRFQAPVSYIGKATDRRITICRSLAEDGLSLYGRRWKNAVKDTELKKCIRSRTDVIGEDVVRIYSSSTCIINLLQGKLADEHTILSLQVFAVPATGGCLITEKTVELEESFVPGQELLCWETEEELQDKVRWAVRNPESARRIGQAGRARCLRDHTQIQRVRNILNLLEK